MTAIQSASLHVLNRTVEVWQGARFVACLKPETSLKRKADVSNQKRRAQASPDPQIGPPAT